MSDEEDKALLRTSVLSSVVRPKQLCIGNGSFSSVMVSEDDGRVPQSGL